MAKPQKIVPAASREGRVELKRILKDLKDKIPKNFLRYNYDGIKGEATQTRNTIHVWRIDPVCWAIPMDEIMFSTWFTNFMNLQVMPWDDMVTATSTYLPNARNICHDRYLNETHTQWLMMLDSDVLPPPDMLQRLFTHTKKQDVRMVGGWYRKKGDGYKPVVYDYGFFNEEIGEHCWNMREKAGKGLEAVDGAGAGCWLMAREVAEALGPSPYDMATGGEDLKLCLKVHEKGYKTWIDWSIACAHAGVGYI